MTARFNYLLIIVLLITGQLAHAEFDWFNLVNKQHLNFRITQDGIKTIALSALNTVKEKSGKMVFSIPAQKVTGKEQIKNPKFAGAIEVINELAMLDLGQPFTYTFTTTKGTAKAFVDSKNVKLELIDADENSFILNLSTVITDIEVSVPKLSVCEGKSCSKNGIRFDITGASIKQKESTKLKVSAKLKVKVKDGVASASLHDLKTNLGDEYGPEIDVNFKTLKSPPVSIFINDQETIMDTSKILELVMGYKVDIANQIINQVAMVMRNDVENIVNKFLKGKNFSTKFSQEYKKKTEPHKVDEFADLPKPMPQDNTYVYIPPMKPISSSNDLTLKKSVQEQIVAELEKMVDSAKFGLSVSKIEAQNNILELAFNPSFVINGDYMFVPGTMGYGVYKKEQQKLSYSSAPSDYNVAIGISESLVNSVISTPYESVQMINSLLKYAGDFKGVYVESPGVKLHIHKGKIYIIVNLHVNFDEVPVKGTWNNVKKWFASVSEMFHDTHGHFRFPLELAMTPAIITNEAGEKCLQLKPTSPISGSNLKNTFGYYSNLKKATEAIKDELVKQIKTAVSKSFKKDIIIPLKELNQKAELKVDPKAIGVEDSGHLVIYGKVNSLDLKKIMGKK